MSVDKLPSVNLAPGGAVSSTHFNISSANSVEYNIYGEFTRRFEHAMVDWVVTIPTFTDTDFEVGYNATNALQVTINGSDAATIDISPGVAYLGGRRYKQISTTTGYSLVGSSDATYLIRLKFQLSTNSFTFIVETGVGSSDSATVKYLTLASGVWDQTTTQTWTSMTDKRSTNTSLPAPITFTDAITGTILTIEQTGSTGHTLKVVGNATGGDVQFFDTTNPRIFKLYGTSSSGFTIYDDTTNSVVLSCDASGRLLVNNAISTTTGTFGSVVASGTIVQGFNTLTFDSTATIGATSATAIAFSGLNFTGIGTIGSGAITSTSTVSATQYTSTIGIGTAPLVVTSTTKVTNLHADSVDGYEFSGSTGTVTADVTELNKIDGYTGLTADLNRTNQTGRALGDIFYASATDTLSWLAASDGVLNNSSGTVSWSLTPSLTSMTVGASGITFDITGTDPVISAGDAALYFGDTVTLSDKASTPDWSITGAGVADFKATTVTTLTASTTIGVTTGPTLTTTGITGVEALDGVTTIDGTGAWATTSTIDFSGILSGATKTEINDAAYATGRAAGDLRYASAINTLGWLAAGTDGYFLRMDTGVPAWESVSFDNYGSWKFRANAGSTDAINTGDILTFEDGSGINITQTSNKIIITNTQSVENTPSFGETSKAITSGWAYSHAVDHSVNLHTKVGALTAGSLAAGFTAVTNARLASFGASAESDQDTSTDASPEFIKVNLTNDPVTPSSGVSIGSTGAANDRFRVQSSLGNWIEFDPYSSAPAGIRIIIDSGDLIIENSIIPSTTNNHDLGTSSYYYANIFCNELSYITLDPSPWDHVDDLEIIKSVRPHETKKTKDGRAMAILTGLPSKIYDPETSIINSSEMNMLLIGGIKQLILKVEELEETIDLITAS